MKDFLEYMNEVEPGFVSEAKEDKKKCDNKKGEGLFAKFSKKKEVEGEEEEEESEKEDSDDNKPEFPANFLKKDK